MQIPNKQEPRWERRKDARPKELIEAALEVFVEKGYAATRLDDVAKRAGVSKGTVYLYFTNKEELFKAVVREGIVPSIAHAEEAMGQFKGSVAELLRRLMKGWWQNIGSTRFAAIPKIIMAEAGNFPEIAKFYHEEVIQRGERITMQVLKLGIDAGEFRPVDVFLAMQLIVAPLLFLCIWKHSLAPCMHDDMDAERYLDAHIDMTLRGLAKNPRFGDRQ